MEMFLYIASSREASLLLQSSAMIITHNEDGVTNRQTNNILENSNAFHSENEI